MQYHAPSLEGIFEQLSKDAASGPRIYILDACRNDGNQTLLNLLTNRSINGGKQISIGQSDPKIAGPNNLIAFATAPGTTASDRGNNSKNGLYTACLIEAISQYGMSIEDTFKLVREKVIERNGYKQIPWEHSSLRTYISFDYYDVPCNLVDTITVPFDMLLSSAISADCKLVALAGNSGRVIYEDICTANGKWIDFGNSNTRVQGEVVDLIEEYLFVGDSEGYLHRFGIIKESVLSRKVFEKGFFAMSVSADEQTIVVCGDRGIVKQLRVNDLELVCEVNTEITTIHSVLHTPSATDEVIVCGDNYRLEVWNIVSGTIVLAIENEMFYTNVAAFSKDGNILVTGHEDGVVQVWCASQYKLIQCINLAAKVENMVSLVEIIKDGGEPPTNHILSLSFAADSNLLSIGTSDPSLVFYDVKYGQLIKHVKLDFSVSRIYSMSQTFGGELLICSGHKRKAYVFASDRVAKIYRKKKLRVH